LGTPREPIVDLYIGRNVSVCLSVCRHVAAASAVIHNVTYYTMHRTFNTKHLVLIVLFFRPLAQSRRPDFKHCTKQGVTAMTYRCQKC